MFVRRLFCYLSFLLLAACLDGSKKTTTTKLVTVTEHAMVKPFYFNGTIAPLRKVPVLSPVAGHVVKLGFKYGDHVKKGQLLAVLSSKTLAQSYRQAVTSYLQKKNTYQTSLKTLQSDKALWKAGVISKQSYDTSNNTYETNVLSYYQAKIALEKILNRVGLGISRIEKMKLSDFRQLEKILHKSFDRIKVYSPANGVALFALNNNSSGSSSGDSSLMEGSEVKRDQLLLLIGDMRGLSAVLKVGEVNINQIHQGFPVTMTGVAFPGLKLHGRVDFVASQASGASGSQQAGMFSVRVSIPTLTKKQRQLIHVGMTAKMTIAIHLPKQLVVPVSAIRIKDNMTYVLKQVGQKQQKVTVVTGATSENSVSILSGLSKGDQVVVEQAANH